jgi:hypothetical protein
MVVTLVSIAVVLTSIFLVGAPLSWLLNGRTWSGEQAWLESPFLGIAAIVLILQNLVYLDLPIRFTGPLIWVAGLAGWVWMYRCKVVGTVFATIPGVLFGITLAIYLLQGIGLFIVGAKYYVGRAWVDQYNYTVLAQFLADERFSMQMSEIGNRPYLVMAVILKGDRIGQSVLHSFFATSSLQNAKTLFEPTILLAPALTVLAIYALGYRFRLSKPIALLTGAAAGLLPAITIIHLESFLSHALGLPLLLLYPSLLIGLSEQPDWRRLSVCAIIGAAITSIYTEFWIILLSQIMLILVMVALRTPHTWRLLIYCGVLILAPFVLNPVFTSSVLTIFDRISTLSLGQDQIYPWALSIEGIGRIWFGDLVAMPGVSQILIRIFACAATMLGFYGLMSRCINRLSIGREVWATPEQWHALIFALGILALALLPAAALAYDSQRSYQFYKLLLSISPLLVLGVALAFQPHHSMAASTPVALLANASARQPVLLTLVVLGAILTGSAAGTVLMALESTTLQPMTNLQPARRYNGPILFAPEMQQLQERLEALHDSNLFFYDAGNVTLWNAWLVYFARHNKVWLGSPRFVNRIDLASIPETRSIVDLNTIPSDVLVLSRAGEVELTAKQSLLWSNEFYQLWTLGASSWIVPLQFENKNGFQTANGQPFFWVGQGDTTISVLAAKGGQLHLTATFVLGPSAPTLGTRRVLLTTEHGYRREVVLKGGIQSIVLPIEAGKTSLIFHPLDQPTVTKLPSGDTRPLLLGVRGLRFAIEP